VLVLVLVQEPVEMHRLPEAVLELQVSEVA
jgi:hypothetical protein